MYRPEGTKLTWHLCTPEQARGVLMRNKISGRLFTRARAKLLHPSWDSVGLGPSVYVIDTLTNKGARITIQGPDEFDVKISRRTGTELLVDITDQMPALVDSLVIKD